MTDEKIQAADVLQSLRRLDEVSKVFSDAAMNLRSIADTCTSLALYIAERDMWSAESKNLDVPTEPIIIDWKLFSRAELGFLLKFMEDVQTYYRKELDDLLKYCSDL